MKNLISIFSLLVILLSESWSQGPDNGNFVITHGPWLQNLSSTGVTIIWTTNRAAVPGISLKEPDGPNRFIRNSHEGIIDGAGTLHRVRVEGLKPGTEYKYSLNSVQILKYQAYRIYYGDTLATRDISFITPPLKSEKVSFSIFNDIHELSGKLGSFLKQSNIAEQEFCFFNGDMVSFLQESDQLFTGFLDTASVYFASGKPFYYIRGNHETRGFSARELKKWFDFKDDRFYYSFDRGPVHFTVLDCGEDKPDNNVEYFGLADYDAYRLKELEWLKEEVKSDAFKNADFRIVMVHMPIIREEKQNWGMKFLAQNFGPVLQKSDVDLMISAHTHRNTFYEKDKSGFGYPVLVNSNNSFVEVVADQQGIKAVVRNAEGKALYNYQVK